MTKARHELSWNSDAKVPNGKPKGGFKSQNGFTINTGVVNPLGIVTGKHTSNY